MKHSTLKLQEKEIYISRVLLFYSVIQISIPFRYEEKKEKSRQIEGQS